MKRISVITGTRAEYGLLYWLLRAIKEDTELELQLVVTGMHLSPEFGLTYQRIEEDGFEIADKVEMLLSSDTEVGMTKAIGLGCIGFGDSFSRLEPDLVMVLGDRFEILAAGIAAMIEKIPVAHLHGGEATEGLIDEPIRHSLTKLSTFHFPSTKKYAKRIIQMGEKPDRVFTHGAPGLDNIHRVDLLSVDELEGKLDFPFSEEETALITYHPVTLENNTAEGQIENLLESLSRFNLNVIFTKANADTSGRVINQKISSYAQQRPDNCKLFDNLGQKKYLSVMKHANIIVGNSSSGLIEAPSFKLPVVNIGDRQKGRIKPGNVIDCGYSRSEITEAIKKALSDTFQEKVKQVKNPYDPYEDGEISERIKNEIKSMNLENLDLKTPFYDVDFKIDGQL